MCVPHLHKSPANPHSRTENSPHLLPYGLETVLFGIDARRPVLTKSQQAYADVRRAIIRRALPAHTALEESFLLQHFPYGRTPLREALKRLAHERLLAWPPHQAPSIRDIGLYEIQHLYAMRRLLENEIAVLAAKRATVEDIDRMDSLQSLLVQASNAGHVYEAVELDFALHAAISSATQNRFLAEASNHLNVQSLRMWYYAQSQLGVAGIHRSHTDLVTAIREHDPEGALALSISHIKSSLDRQQAILKPNDAF
ncbi:MAG TPA: GntR family transcriptional regulator [Thermomicrobiales bacterium]|nr:GntR family transcriptional regulator [Thermomicrobiales bacterium]